MAKEDMKMNLTEERNLIGACGIYCGLCTKYQSKAKSKCVGCKLGGQHSWCSIWNCCVKKNKFETCAECDEYPCERYERRLIKYPEDWKIARENLERIKKDGINSWFKEQKRRQLLVEELLENYDEGRSMSFFCKICIRMPTNLINESIKETKIKIVTKKIGKTDIKAKAKILKSIVEDLASKSNIDLK